MLCVQYGKWTELRHMFTIYKRTQQVCLGKSDTNSWKCCEIFMEFISIFVIFLLQWIYVHLDVPLLNPIPRAYSIAYLSLVELFQTGNLRPINF